MESSKCNSSSGIRLSLSRPAAHHRRCQTLLFRIRTPEANLDRENPQACGCFCLSESCPGGSTSCKAIEVEPEELANCLCGSQKASHPLQILERTPLLSYSGVQVGTTLNISTSQPLFVFHITLSLAQGRAVRRLAVCSSAWNQSHRLRGETEIEGPSYIRRLPPETKNLITHGHDTRFR